MKNLSASTKNSKQPTLKVESLIKQIDGRASEKTTDLVKRIKQLEAQLMASAEKDSAANRKADTRAKIIIGAALLAKAAEDDTFKIVLRKVISLIVRKQDVEALRKSSLTSDALGLEPITPPQEGELDRTSI